MNLKQHNMRLTKLLLTTAIIALLGAGCANAPAPVVNKNANAPTTGASRALPASGAFVVAIDQNGEFYPVTAYVTKGTVITFVNNSSKPHSIVPITDAGKKFDLLASKNDIAPGEKFTVTMDQAGRWLYSDGTNPAFGGAVEVSE
jgi:plastocyanin